jgi:hypothetical protein
MYSATSGFRLVSAEVKDLTPEFAEQFHNLEASPTERSLEPSPLSIFARKLRRGNWSRSIGPLHNSAGGPFG